MYFPVFLHLWYLLMHIFSETDTKISMPSHYLERLSGDTHWAEEGEECFQIGMTPEFQAETLA